VRSFGLGQSSSPTTLSSYSDWHSAIGSGTSWAVSFSLNGIRRREAKVSDVGGIDGLRPLPTLYTAIVG